MARPTTNIPARACPALLITTLTAGAIIFGVIASGGCVRRALTIESDPPGALVFLNDQEIGQTPVTAPFTWYGTYDVRLEKEGYRTLQTEQELQQPWWEYPGPDLLAEAIPNKRVLRRWSFVLETADPADEIDPDALLDHARQMRELTQHPPSE